MAKKPNTPLRRAQLISPFGVGAMVTAPGGVSMIVAGLDTWYEANEHDNAVIDYKEFREHEWRLERVLGVDHFRLPPDYRRRFNEAQGSQNEGLLIPAYRFPRWHFCPECHQLTERSAYERGRAGRIECVKCKANNKRRQLYQVPFVAMCAEGHIQDFPWREWVHRTAKPTCKRQMYLRSTGSATLAGQVVRCECGKHRRLAGITRQSGDTTTLSTSLIDGDELYLCRGRMPWIDAEENENCSAHLRGSLRSASNVYYAQVRSAIYLPRSQNERIQEVVTLLEQPLINNLVTLATSLDDSQVIVNMLRGQYEAEFAEYDDEELLKGCEIVKDNNRERSSGNDYLAEDEIATAFRYEEFVTLQSEQMSDVLSIEQAPMSDYQADAAINLKRIGLVHKLKETRVLAGFTRVYPDTEDVRALIPKLAKKSLDWLPATIVYGEGLFFEFEETALRKWEQKPEVQARVQPLIKRYSELQAKRHMKDRPLGPRFVMVHTFAHLLMNELTFECGYSSAALRERLYVANSDQHPMAGVLLYTANGDSEGTLGGLVRMGKPGYLEPVIRKALARAAWCSADPVCMEMGSLNGQGPDSCNLAACHGCGLVPETACEEFNRFLDRALLIGTPDNEKLGFFRQ